MFLKFEIFAFCLFIYSVESSWIKVRRVQYQGGMDQHENIGQHYQVRSIRKTFLPPRYQNLWGHGESSKIIDSSALSAQNMDDYKMPTQQRQVFSWQPATMMDW